MLYPPELRARAWIIATYGTPSNLRMAGVPENVPTSRRHCAFFGLARQGLSAAFPDQPEGRLARCHCLQRASLARLIPRPSAGLPFSPPSNGADSFL